VTQTVLNQIQEQFHAFQAQDEDLYVLLNHFRDWVNQTLANYELFLEDTWFDGRTTLEYTLRCLDTFNILVVAEDEYTNFRDSQTWHLGPYVRTYWIVDDPWGAMAQFIQENPEPRFKVG
jgi:hypothetical protein